MSAGLKDWVKQRSAQGVRTGLLARLFPPSGSEFQTLVIADDLGQLQEDRKKALANPAVIAFIQKIDGLSRAPMSVGLFEVLVAAQRMPTENEFLVRISHYPAVGKTGEFVASATEMTRKLQSDGLVINLVSQAFSSEGAVLQSVLTLKNLIEWQGFQKRVRTDTSIQDWVKAVAAISRCALTSEIWELQSLPAGR